MARVQPEFNVKVGGIQITVWPPNEVDKGKFSSRSFTIKKSYFDGKEWKESKSFKANDIQLLQLALTKTLDYLFTPKDKQEKENVPF